MAESAAENSGQAAPATRRARGIFSTGLCGVVASQLGGRQQRYSPGNQYQYRSDHHVLLCSLR